MREMSGSSSTKRAKIHESAAISFFRFVPVSHNGAYASKRESSLALIYSLSLSVSLRVSLFSRMCEILRARLESYHGSRATGV